ncbi:DUF5684 domain-containing protein [Microbacterium sp. NPDC089188]|uniref:DUF5684 domain-containing protein n=1 Tax=Microbacterium sp. NPDC089188 TaxID=3154971 RepID=UPI003420B7F2
MNISNLAYSDYGTTSAGEAAVLAVVYLFIFLFSILGYLISSFLLMKVFEKAGVQGKWRAWVPVYNALVYAKLGDFSPWILLGLAVASAIPILNFLAGLAIVVALIMISYRVAAKFGRDWPILLLFLLGPLGQWIFLGILGFSSNRWNPAAASPSPWGSSFLADKTFWNGIPAQPAQNVQGQNGGGYGAPVAPPAQGYAPPAAPGYAPPQAPPASGSTPPPQAPPAGPQV